MTRLDLFPILLLVAALSAGFVACNTEDDGDGDGNTSDAGGRDRDLSGGSDIPGLDAGVNQDTGGGGGDTGAGGDTGGGLACDDIPTNTEAGTACTGAEGECADGVCISESAGGASTCRQVCIPDVCEDECTGSDRCLSVIDENGDPIEVTPGIPLGVCGEPATGDQGAYDPCSQALGACEAGLACILRTAGDTEGQCLPECTGGEACPALNGLAGECLAQAGTDRFCIVPCETAGSDECGAGFACETVQAGLNVCTPE